jgi:REP element-mobilizing transposase RayT
MHQQLLAVWKEADAWRVGKYMIMPDHIHMFCSPMKRDVSLKSWVSYWKSLATRAVAGYGPIGSGETEPSNTENKSTRIFQRDYWDTQLRHGEHYSGKWTYVQNNPVRAGLVTNSSEWPYQGELNVLFWHND